MNENDARLNNPFFRLNPETEELIVHERIVKGEMTGENDARVEVLRNDGTVEKHPKPVGN